MSTRKKISGFAEVAHVSDCAIRVWAPSFEQLLIEAASGMYKLMELEELHDSFCSRSMVLKKESREDQLVSFLSKLLYLLDYKNMYFYNFQINVNSCKITTQMTGSLIKSKQKLIKAATYSFLSIKESKDGYETIVVFDV